MMTYLIPIQQGQGVLRAMIFAQSKLHFVAEVHLALPDLPRSWHEIVLERGVRGRLHKRVALPRATADLLCFYWKLWRSLEISDDGVINASRFDTWSNLGRGVFAGTRVPVGAPFEVQPMVWRDPAGKTQCRGVLFR